MDIRKLAHVHDFDFQSSLGQLRVGPFTIGVHRDLHKRFPDSNAANPSEVVRFLLLRMAGRPAEESKGPVPLSEQEVTHFTPQDLDDFAKQFIESNRSWLFKSYTGDEEKDSERISPTIEIPQGQGEDMKVYLMRLLSSYLKRRAAYNRDLMRRVLPKSLLSDATSKLLEKNFSISKDLARFLGSANKHLADARSANKLNDIFESARKESADAQFVSITRPEPARFEPLPVPPNPIHRTNETLDEVVTQLESMAAVSNKSAELIQNMNDLGLSMAKSSAEHAERTAKQNRTMISYALGAIVVTALGIVVSTIFSAVTFFQDRDKDAATATLLNQVSKHLDSSQQALVATQKAADARQAALQAESKALAEERNRKKKPRAKPPQ